MKSVVSKSSKLQPKATEAAPAGPVPGPLMSSDEAKAFAAVTTFGMVRVADGFAFVRLKVQGDKVLEATFSEPEDKMAIFDNFKKAAARTFIQNDVPEARWPEKEPS